MATDGVWLILDRFAYTYTSSTNVGISEARMVAPQRNCLSWHLLRTVTCRTPPIHELLPRFDQRDSKFDLMRCAIPNLFDNTLCGSFCQLRSSGYAGEVQYTVVDLTSSLARTFVPWDIMVKVMPTRWFAMPLARAAVEHRRLIGLLEPSFFVHLLITCLLITLLSVDPQDTAVLAILFVAVALDSLVLVDEGLQMLT
eukprot:scaffold129335_cov13-Prasinocladus_malaysianus.AAC.1